MRRCSRPSVTGAATSRLPRQGSGPSSGRGATCAGSGRGSAVTTAFTGSTGRIPATGTQRSNSYATYPEPVMFAKGHGTENDFVVLPDVGAQLALTPAAVSAMCDRRRGLGADG